MVLPSNLEIILPLSGLMLGISLGMIGGFSREEKVRIASISTFGAINVAFIGISFYAYGYSLEVRNKTKKIFNQCLCFGWKSSSCYLEIRGC